MAHRTLARRGGGSLSAVAYPLLQRAGPRAGGRFVPPPWEEGRAEPRPSSHHQAEQELRIVSGCFSLRNAKDALPLPVAFDQGGHPEDSFKHLLLLSARR